MCVVLALLGTNFSSLPLTSSWQATLFATIMSISNFGGDFSHFWGAALLSALGVSRSDFSQLWIGVLIRVLCCAIPAVAALWLVPEGGPADAVDEFQKTMGLRAQAGGLEEGMAVGGDGSGGGGGGRASTPTTPTRSAPSR